MMRKKKGTNVKAYVEPMISFQIWETNWTKNNLRKNIGWHPNDEKPKWTKNKLRLNIVRWHNDEKSKE